jgi:tetratricopeptide (TPR) repeat protein
MATMLDLAKEAFNARNFFLACEIFEGCLSAKDKNFKIDSTTNSSAIHCNLDIYYGYGDSLARMGRLKEAFDCYAHIIDYLCGTLATDRLKHLAYGLIECALSRRTNTTTNSTISNNSNCNNNLIVNSNSLSNSSLAIINSDVVDPLCCSICEDILKYPVTAVCGHTYCRQCCFGRSHCNTCGQMFPSTQSTLVSTSTPASCSSVLAPLAFSMETSVMDCGGFEQDVLVKRLVERWWGPELLASELNEEAQSYYERNALDDALRCCNESLEKGKSVY